ncbi:Stp1/IreP family PP2C-type Ser/Thr phosphatase [Peribacillus cavernae]|uniref:protein-serine/threonine phosphatase n=1 Tax=Peribacillus cavernae TaxID=1674310 RepID=A0A3S0TYK1_9BACI|nr:Stp1/IreP family PP2C-type Ser/Thr phosphatase [Peribacillus cavernae]MDQ0217126.1 protein phosphatase [Peribacillus cavernae]RUQ30397.1 Stp1/IreP family PP2C-type Ser/Thr phosphatase [Peribacillus cavernae]
MKAVFRTDRGKIRQHNEDNGGIFINPEGVRFAVVADGMGGHRAGDVASSMTVEHIHNTWNETVSVNTPQEAESWLREKIEHVNRKIFEHSEQNSEYQGMGTTIVAAICTDKFATIANIGDSRCYLNNESGFKQVTEDHSLVNELVRSGQITREDAEHHPRKNVLVRALGTEKNVDMDISTIVFEEGDVLLLCSDGLSNKVSEKEMVEIITAETNLEEKADSFIELANLYGGEDNITLVLVQFYDESESG